MTEKRKVKKRKESFELVSNKKVDKPSKDELIIAKWLKKNVPVKKTKFAGHNVEYFTGSKAVDALLNSKWCVKEDNKEPLFLSREDIIYFMDAMLRHRFFHRAKKVPVSEQELKAKSKKKEKKPVDEDKKKKDDETAESSHAENRDLDDAKSSQHDDRKKKCCKIKLEMHGDQSFVDNLDAYVWIYDPIPLYYWIIGALVVLATVGVCLFPLWPPTVRMGVQYVSMAAAGLLILILVLAVLRLIIFCIIWLITLGALHLWLLPNLTEDVGFFASFWPLYQYTYTSKGGVVITSGHSNGKEKKNKKKKDKESDDEDNNGYKRKKSCTSERNHRNNNCDLSNKTKKSDSEKSVSRRTSVISNDDVADKEKSGDEKEDEQLQNHAENRSELNVVVSSSLGYENLHE